MAYRAISGDLIAPEVLREQEKKIQLVDALCGASASMTLLDSSPLVAKAPEGEVVAPVRLNVESSKGWVRLECSKWS